MDKHADAFRTIGEAAEELDLPQHVLRFWETRFSQIRPMKRSGGRRYYRREDVELLAAIRHLLYGEGYTIKGVQRILKQQGGKAVVDLVQQLRDGSVAGDAAVAAPAAVNSQADVYDEASPADIPGATTPYRISAERDAAEGGVAAGLSRNQLQQLAAVLSELEDCAQTLAHAREG